MKISSLESYIVAECPTKVYYIPNFITEYEETDLLDLVKNAPKPKWTYLKNRRLQNWGGLPHPKGMIAEPIPSWLNEYCMRVFDIGVFEQNKPNHVLINEYLPGQGKIKKITILNKKRISK
jgi:alkylated DNA repair protein alkB family protein 6